MGYTGRGIRVAVLDAGIQATHPDLAPNLNTALSTSFVPGQAYNAPPGAHGTQVAGIIAAARNGVATVGVAPNAEIVMVKILAANGTGLISRFAQGDRLCRRHRRARGQHQRGNESASRDAECRG